MLVKFKQTRMVQTTQNFELLDKKEKKKKKKKKQGFKTISDKALTSFWKMFLELKQLFNANLLISRLPSFSVPKITLVRYE